MDKKKEEKEAYATDDQLTHLQKNKKKWPKRQLKNSNR